MSNVVMLRRRRDEYKEWPRSRFHFIAFENQAIKANIACIPFNQTFKVIGARLPQSSLPDILNPSNCNQDIKLACRTIIYPRLRLLNPIKRFHCPLTTDCRIANSL